MNNANARTLLYITSEGCEHCEETRALLHKIQKEYDLAIKEIDMASPQGMELVMQYRIMLAPAIIIDKNLISMGKVSEKSLREKLQSLL